MGDLPVEILMAIDDKILGVYQDWVHTIPEHIWMAGLKRMVSGRIGGNNWFVCPPNAMMYHLAGLETNLLGFFLWILMEFGISNGTRRG